MVDIATILLKACVIVNGIAFEVTKADGHPKLLATDVNRPECRASFAVRAGDFILSVSSFKEPEREAALMNAIRINNVLLMDEVKNA